MKKKTNQLFDLIKFAPKTKEELMKIMYDVTPNNSKANQKSCNERLNKLISRVRIERDIDISVKDGLVKLNEFRK